MSTLKIAIQKSGRLNEDSIQILKDCGISINNGNDQLKPLVYKDNNHEICRKYQTEQLRVY